MHDCAVSSQISQCSANKTIFKDLIINEKYVLMLDHIESLELFLETIRVCVLE